MCRFLCYIGSEEILLEDLLYRPKNSLILQSYHARERKEPLNGDGFGVGWYTPEISPTPCVFRSLTPAWSNQNLRHISEHVKSTCLFAHVRSASPGMPVSEINCHPFQYGRYLWMHNGTIEGFSRIKRRLRESLPDRLYNAIEGTTDSEHAFAVFLNLLQDTDRLFPAHEIANTLARTVAHLEQLTSKAGISVPSYYNFAVTDGQSVATVRYVSDPTLEPISLYFSEGNKYVCHEGVGQIVDGHSDHRAVIVASEPLTEWKKDWVRVAPNHVLTVTPSLEVKIDLMETKN